MASDGPTQSVRATQSSTASALSQFPVPSGQVENHDDSDTDERSQQSSQQDGQEGPAHAQKRSHHGHHFDVAHTHAFVAANSFVHRRDAPQKKAAERRSEKPVQQPQDWPWWHS